MQRQKRVTQHKDREKGKGKGKHLALHLLQPLRFFLCLSLCFLGKQKKNMIRKNDKPQKNMIRQSTTDKWQAQRQRQRQGKRQAEKDKDKYMGEK